MTAPIPPVFLPYTCLHQCYGFELFRHQGKPWVVHRFSKRLKQPDGTFCSERFVEHMSLDQEWPSNPQAQEARRELTQAWEDWTQWNEANRPSRSTAGPGNGQ